MGAGFAARVVLALVTAATASALPGGAPAVGYAPGPVPTAALASAVAPPRYGVPLGGVRRHAGVPDPRTAGAETRLCDACKPPLVYGGGPAMGTPQASGEVTIQAIYWAPQGFSFADSYKAAINGYLDNIAAASGHTDNVYSVATEYFQVAGGKQSPIQYVIHSAPPIDSTHPYPPNCELAAGFTTCVDDAALRAEISSQNVTPDLAHLYLVFLPSGVLTRDGAGGSSAQTYCGYHSSFPVGDGVTVYANEPYPDLSGCALGQAPSGDPAADSQINTVSHEINESITDPLGNAWADSATPSNETGDECNLTFGDPLGSVDPANPDTTRYNQVIGSGRYYTQLEFSNRDFATGPGHGCTVSTVAGPPATVDTVTVSASPPALPADGRSTSTVSVDIVAADGTPVAGDDLAFATAALNSQASCGTLSALQGKTDARGDATVTYTAAAQSVSCAVMVVEGLTGRPGEVQIASGSASDPVATIQLTTPAEVIRGGAPVDIPASVANSSAGPIDDARLDVVITTGSAAIDSGSVHLSASPPGSGTSGTGFAEVPLSGTTRGGGDIGGVLPSPPAGSLQGGSTLPLTLRLSVDGSPAAAAGDTPITLALYLARVDPATLTTETVARASGDITARSAAAARSSTPSASGGSSGSLFAALGAAAVAMVAAGAAMLVWRSRRRRGQPTPAGGQDEP